jgi:hypothetical protein
MSDQGPPGDHPPPWERPANGFESDPWQPGSPAYPRQRLLPQEIRRRRSRKPVYLGIGLVLVLLLGGAAAYATLRSDGEATRQAYCAALGDLKGDLVRAVDGTDASTLASLKAVVDLAPSAVAGAWATLQGVIAKARSGSPDFTQAMAAFGALRTISRDAQQNCGLDLQIPMM